MRTRQATAFAEFLFEAKSYWMSEIFPALRDDYRARAAGREIATTADVDALIGSTPLYQYFAWLERHIQKEKYSSRYGLLRTLEAERDELEAQLAEVAADPALLALDDRVAVPAYYRAIDTHQHPGNLTGDSLAGHVYKASAGSTQPGPTQGYALHERFAAVLAGHGRFERVLDAGCGFGKSAITIAQRMPEARVEGVDLAPACLRLAALEARDAQLGNLRYRQADVCATPYADGAFDLVTSTMLLHELPPDAVADFLRETYRLLEPGGRAIHLDFHTDDPFLGFLHHGHAKRNNEPYMAQFDRLDVAGLLAGIGFELPRIEFFSEAAEVRSAQHTAWRLPWTVISARKPD